MAAIGLGASLVAWVALSFASARAIKVAIEGLPREWREHPEAGPVYDAALERRAHLSAAGRAAPYLLGAAVGFAVLELLDVLPLVQIGTAVVGGFLWAQRGRTWERATAKAVAERDGLEMPKRLPGRRAYVATLYGLCLAAALAACFAGQVIGALVS